MSRDVTCSHEQLIMGRFGLCACLLAGSRSQQKRDRQLEQTSRLVRSNASCDTSDEGIARYSVENRRRLYSQMNAFHRRYCPRVSTLPATSKNDQAGDAGQSAGDVSAPVEKRGTGRSGAGTRKRGDGGVSGSSGTGDDGKRTTDAAAAADGTSPSPDAKAKRSRSGSKRTGDRVPERKRGRVNVFNLCADRLRQVT